MNKHEIGVCDTTTGEEKIFSSWKDVAKYVSENEIDRYFPILLPFVSGYNLDYIQEDETWRFYRNRLIGMATGFELL